MKVIGWAIKEMQDGQKVRRVGWNGKGMWLFMVTNWEIAGLAPADHPPTHPFVALKSADGALIPWNASQADLVATDWEIAD